MALREHFELNRDREVWIKHYSSNHQILLVGSPYHAEPQCSLATLCGSTSNICASSVDSYGSLPFVCLYNARVSEISNKVPHWKLYKRKSNI